MTTLAIMNRSSDLTDSQARRMTEACRIQIRDHVAPAYQSSPWPVRFFDRKKAVPDDALLLVILDNDTQADALGYHSETPKGRRYGRVFTRPVLEDGGSVSQDEHSVSVILSHEVCEAFVDPDINLWAEGKPGIMWSYEICDPVQRDAYPIAVQGEPVYVSNFVHPTWFDRQNPKKTRFDHMGKLKKPFKMTPGGYAVIWDGGPTESIVYGARRRARKGGRNHLAARSVRRTGGRVSF